MASTVSFLPDSNNWCRNRVFRSRKLSYAVRTAANRSGFCSGGNWRTSSR